MKRTTTLCAVAAAALVQACDSAPTTPTAKAPEKLWEVSDLKGPECALPDTKAGVIYVSNVNGDPTGKDGNGFISKISIDGKSVDNGWSTGLNAPKGLAVSNGHLFVGDVDELVEINLADGKIVAKHAAPGAKLLNDVAVDAKGAVYVSDTMGGSIYRFADGKIEEWLKHEKLQGPNGLLVEGDNLIVNTWGVFSGEGWNTKTPGQVYAVSLADKSFKDVGDGKPFANLDGMQPLGGGAYLLTDWMSGKVLKLHADGKVDTLLELGQGSADIGYDAATKTLFIPQMMKGQLYAYKVE
ncbi:MAG: SMP-30/gluconolactonase/LRE family protein [Hyphomicrobium sp.]